MTTGNVRPASMERITTPELAKKFIDEQISELRAQIGDKKVLLALSGGVDSSVVAALLIKAVGKQLVSVHVNHGLLRKGEPEQVVRVFRDELDANLVYVDATDRFLDKLAGISDPEQKRKIIGAEFIRVFEEEARKQEGISFLAQGTIYPDIVLERNSDCPITWCSVSPSPVLAWVSVAQVPSPVTVWKPFVSPMPFCAKSSKRMDWQARYGSISPSCPTTNLPVSRTISAVGIGPSSSVP